MGACIVANPYAGIAEWFEPGVEVIVVNSAEEALDRYRYLLANERERICDRPARLASVSLKAAYIPPPRTRTDEHHPDLYLTLACLPTIGAR